MRFEPKDPPRVFQAGDVRLTDCGVVHLEPDEQVTFVTPDQAEYDVVRKEWGFYATPSTNGRLAGFGLRTALVENQLGHRFILLVERERQAEFEAYREAEALRVVSWLDSAQPETSPLRCPCQSRWMRTVATYDAPPEGETNFQTQGSGYQRRLDQCELCGHFVTEHDMDLDALYSGSYVDATYGSGMAATFQRIVGLDPAQSDNHGRVEAVLAFAAEWWAPQPRQQPLVMDVGSGLCVFLHAMKAAGWEGLALDPDARAVAHARDVVGVEAMQADFTSSQMTGVSADAITFNKVLEHVLDPVGMLAAARPLLRPGGFVYVELPDGEAAFGDSPARQEFFIEHWHVFSPSSMAMLIERAGFRLQRLERLREPSGKYTLRAFIAP